MTACQALKEEADLAFKQVSDTLEGVSEAAAWAQIPLAPGNWLNTNGTVIGIVQHLAVCKVMYGSTAFRDTEVTWRACFDRLDTIGTSWEANLAYLAEAQQYWLSTWDRLSDAELGGEYAHFRGVRWPGWKVIATVTQHDVYHSGQIAVITTATTPTVNPPDLRLEEERRHVMDLPGY